jgi:hypothetical protein
VCEAEVKVKPPRQRGLLSTFDSRFKTKPNLKTEQLNKLTAIEPLFAHFSICSIAPKTED